MNVLYLSSPRLIGFLALPLALLLLSIQSVNAQTFTPDQWHDTHTGFELAFDVAFQPVAYSSGLQNWLELQGEDDVNVGFSIGAVLYQRLNRGDEFYYDLGLKANYMLMGSVDPLLDDESTSYNLSAFELGASLRTPVPGIDNKMFFQETTLLANGISFAKREFSADDTFDPGTGVGVQMRVGYLFPSNKTQSFNMYVQGGYLTDITHDNANYINLLIGFQFQNLISRF